MRAPPALALVLALLVTAACSGNVLELEVGNCITVPNEGEVTNVEIVDCAEPHENEVFALVDHPAGDDEEFPGAEALSAFATEECQGDRFEEYVGQPYAESPLFASSLNPGETTWGEGDREVVCLLRTQDGSDLTGSQRGSGS